jgi:hypothetical protein
MVAKLKDFQILLDSYCHDIQSSFGNKTVTLYIAKINQMIVTKKKGPMVL